MAYLQEYRNWQRWKKKKEKNCQSIFLNSILKILQKNRLISFPDAIYLLKCLALVICKLSKWMCFSCIDRYIVCTILDLDCFLKNFLQRPFFQSVNISHEGCICWIIFPGAFVIVSIFVHFFSVMWCCLRNLNDNQLQYIPEGVFAGLSNLKGM